MKNTTSSEKQFTEILENHKKLVFKIANSYCNDSEERKDLVQEIVLQLWKAYPKYNTAFSLSTWIYRIALNVSISFYRKEKTRKKTVEEYKQVVELIDHDPFKNEKMEQLYKMIEKLNPLEKAVMILYLEGKNQKEMAEIIGTSNTNISTRINRIKNKLSLTFQSQNE